MLYVKSTLSVANSILYYLIDHYRLLPSDLNESSLVSLNHFAVSLVWLILGTLLFTKTIFVILNLIGINWARLFLYGMSVLKMMGLVFVLNQYPMMEMPKLLLAGLLLLFLNLCLMFAFHFTEPDIEVSAIKA